MGIRGSRSAFGTGMRHYRIYSHTRKAYYQDYVEGDGPGNFGNFGADFSAIWFPSRANAVDWMAQHYSQETYGNNTIELVPAVELIEHALNKYNDPWSRV